MEKSSSAASARPMRNITDRPLAPLCAVIKISLTTNALILRIVKQEILDLSFLLSQNLLLFKELINEENFHWR